ncbi:transmembrane transporter, putative [Perkinsus marinus ATCC 50983]|uniref:Transmembrane transporter, putative n=1 Tax=Perkinsus marinus (strain ATCC 50983 / TXsc) TaxID=423536 RepID=C5KYE9_PERM5|nr:transmembrane transporter, putative [Perkinsus marinus ATCC 50983]EER10526.1 transmembrane transporter, putative [Perkinsus marinus ATCC 50983]|eukprot:XP_002778731.1 transmembrane transporter, putative [Perkinsus marinus ATCC 50983]
MTSSSRSSIEVVSSTDSFNYQVKQESSLEESSSKGGGKTTTVGAMANLVMICIGIGILGLPLVMQQAGWIGGYVLLFLAGLSSLWMGKHLADACQAYASTDSHGNRVFPSYQSLGYMTYGTIGRASVIVTMDIFMLGLCVVLLVLFADNTLRIWPVLNRSSWILIYAAIMVFLVWIRSMRLIAWLSIGGVISVFATVAVVLVAGFNRLAAGGGDTGDPITYSLFNFSDLGAAFGTLMTSFGLTAMIPSVMNNMEKPDKVGVSLYGAFVIIFSVYICLTVAGYGGFGNSIAKYGDIVTAISGTSSTLNAQGYAIIICILILCASHFLALFFPVATDCEKLISAKAPKFTVYVVRTVLVGICALLATVVPGVTDMISLLGSVCGMPNVMLLPLLFYWKACLINAHGMRGIYQKRIIKFMAELFIFALSIFTFVYGLYGSIHNIVSRK